MAKKRRRNRDTPTRQQRRHPDNPGSLIDVIIPSFGRPGLVTRCLQSLNDTKEDLDLQVIIVDDASPDVAAMHTAYDVYPDARVLWNSDNLGFPASCNRGARHGRSRYLVFLNTDVELQPGCLQAMLGEMSTEDVGVVGPRLLFHPDSTLGPPGTIQHAGIMCTIKGQLMHANIGWRADHPKVLQRRDELQAVTGALMMVRRSTWEAVSSSYQRANGDITRGGFNRVYGRGTYEDVELCILSRAMGQRVVYAPDAVAWHLVGGSSHAKGIGYDIQRNDLIFKARCGHLLLWDEWRYW